jgi:hypothetical protein
MNISELAAQLNYRIITPSYEDKEIASGYTSDLLSDVMGNAEENAILITIQAHKNTVAVASQLDLAAILICNGRSIPAEMQAAAEQFGIAILSTEENQFISSYKVYDALHG